MVDMKIDGCGWVKVNRQKWYAVQNIHCESTAQMEAMAHYADVYRMDEDSIVPLRVLSFDIECLPAQDGTFPQANVDPVLTIACVLVEHTAMNNHLARIVLQMRDTAKLNNATIFTFDDERDMLKSFSRLMVILDPDIVTGYNIQGFDSS